MSNYRRSNSGPSRPSSTMGRIPPYTVIPVSILGGTALYTYWYFQDEAPYTGRKRLLATVSITILCTVMDFCIEIGRWQLPSSSSPASRSQFFSRTLFLDRASNGNANRETCNTDSSFSNTGMISYHQTIGHPSLSKGSVPESQQQPPNF